MSLSAGLVGGAVVDARVHLPGASFGALAVVCCVMCGGSVAWRRFQPVWACAAACTGCVGLLALTAYDGSAVFEWVPVALTLYTVGRQTARRPAALLLVSWLGATSLLFGPVQGGLPAAALAFPSYALGRWFATRRSLIKELAARVEELEREQALTAREAVDEERRGMARELHDVVAHCVSVAVVQTVGARSVAPNDRVAAAGALSAVERAGREALVELRRIVGVVRHDGGPLTEAAMPTLARLDSLAERARSAGIQVKIDVAGQRRPLAAGLELVVYRLIQEALTNVIKHAGTSRAEVRLSYRESGLTVEVWNSDGGTPILTESDGHGHGLHGLRERVALYGGKLEAGPAPAGGFSVRALLPYVAEPMPAPSPPATERTTHADTAVRQRRWPWLDPLLASVTLLAAQAQVLSGEPRGPLVLSVLAAAALALGASVRRSRPIVFAVTVVSMTLVLIGLGPFQHSLITIVLLAWVLYTLAAWTGRPVAAAGLLGILGMLIVGQLRGTNGANAGEFAGMVFLTCVPWVCGVAIRSRRQITHRLAHLSAQLEVERIDRARLAVAAERSRIARELQTVVARSLAGIVVQAEAAAALLDHDIDGAEALMANIEQTGRDALVDMRRILGVLRHPGGRTMREPQPGIDQIHTLIRRARTAGQTVEFEIEGDPMTLEHGVELALYRILEEALHTARPRPDRPLEVALRFGGDQLELRVSGDARAWPTQSMREYASMCAADLALERDAVGGPALFVRLPTTVQEVAA